MRLLAHWGLKLDDGSCALTVSATAAKEVISNVFDFIL
jgi:hypothetical protein